MNILVENWEIILGLTLSIGWVLVRLMPTGKNRDIVENLLSILSRLVPNYSNETDEDGNKLSHADLSAKQRRELRKEKRKSKKEK